MISFFVPGVPKPGGSKKAFYSAKLGRSIIVEDCKGNKDWRAVVAVSAQQARGNAGLFEGPLVLSITFVMPRPKGHYRSNGTLKPAAPVWHTSRPDTTKLIRSTEDALTNVLWNDDAQIAVQRIEKVYGETPGASVRVEQIKENQSGNHDHRPCDVGARAGQERLQGVQSAPLPGME